jgi:hypothetical protein
MSIDESKLVFLDTETTGLDPDRHQIWDLAFIRDDVEHEYRFEPDLTKADPMALKIGRYYERTLELDWKWNGRAERVPDTAAEIARLLYGRHIVGAVPSFDDGFLKRFMLANGQAVSTWHYHLIDVEALAVGFLANRESHDEGAPMPSPSWKSDELSNALGVDPDEFDRHTALGDARWVKSQYEAVMGR